MKKIFITLFTIIILSTVTGVLGNEESPIANTYYLGLKSSDNTISNIQTIESQYGLKIPVVSFIFDPRTAQDVPALLSSLPKALGTDRIYHLTVSPNLFTAQQVADGAFDAEYLQFFQTIREKKLKVIFRTMHEMNGGRYPRSSNPDAFKQARIHIRNLSRTVGLDQSDILFDFSVNHRDMPTTAKIPSQISPLTQCTPDRTDCYHFEDYYPGNNYVDLIGFTFYNWGKATSGRQRLTPSQILLSSERNTLSRLKAIGKPLIIDEVGTTSVRYSEGYSREKSREMYLQDSHLKDQRLSQLQSFLQANPEIILSVYFNVDYTIGLQFPTVGEADWAVLNPSQNKIYQSFFSLYQNSNLDLNSLASYFLNSKVIDLNGHKIIVQKTLIDYLKTVKSIIDKAPDTSFCEGGCTKQTGELFTKLLKIRRSDHKMTKSLEILKNLEL